MDKMTLVDAILADVSNVDQVVDLAVIGSEEAAGALFHCWHFASCAQAITDAVQPRAAKLAGAGNTYVLAISLPLLPADSPLWLKLFSSKDRNVCEMALRICPKDAPVWDVLLRTGRTHQYDWAMANRGTFDYLIAREERERKRREMHANVEFKARWE